MQSAVIFPSAIGDVDDLCRIDQTGHESIAELDVASTISEVLDTISSAQQVVRVKNTILTVIDLLSAVKDLGIMLSQQGTGGGLIGLASQIESAATDRLGKDAINLPLELFESVAANAPRIAEANLLSPTKDARLVSAFTASDAAILLYLPGFVGRIEPISTGLQVAGRPLKITTQGGGALLGMGFSGAEQPTQSTQFFLAYIRLSVRTAGSRILAD